MSIFSKIADIFKKKDNTPAAQETAPTQVAPAAGSSNSTTPAGNVFKPSMTMTVQKGSSGKKETVDVGFKPISYEEFSPSSKVNTSIDTRSLSDRSKANDAANGVDWSNASARQKQYNDTYYKTLDDPTHTKMYRDLESASRYGKDATKEYRANRDALDDELDRIAKEKGRSSDEYRALQKFVDDYTELGRQMVSGYTKKESDRVSKQADDTIDSIFSGVQNRTDYQQKVAEGKQGLDSDLILRLRYNLDAASEKQRDMMYYVYATEGKEAAREFFDRFIGDSINYQKAAKDFADDIANDSKLARFWQADVANAVSAFAGNVGTGFRQTFTDTKVDPNDRTILGDYSINDSIDDYLRQQVGDNIKDSTLKEYGTAGFAELQDKVDKDWIKDATQNASEYQKQFLGYLYLATGSKKEAREAWESLKQRGDAIWQTVNGKGTIATAAASMESQMYRDYFDLAGGEDGEKTVARVIWDLAETTRAQYPQIAANLLGAAAGAPGAGRVLGAFVMSLPAYGNEYKQAVDEGKNPTAAAGYAASQALNEFVTDYVLSGIAPIAGSLTNDLGLRFVKNISNPLLRAVANSGVRALGEGAQEYIQEIVTNPLRNAWFAEQNSFEPFSEEAAYNFFLGAMSAFLMGPVNTSMETRLNTNFTKVGEALNGQNSMEKLVDTVLNNPVEGGTKEQQELYEEAAKLAKHLKDGSVKPTDVNVGEVFGKYAKAGGDTSFLTNPNTVAYNKETLTPDNLLAGATSMLVDLGGDVELADAIVKAATNQALTQEQLEAIQNDQAAVQVLSQLLGELDMTQDTALTRAARSTTMKSTTGNKVYDTLKAENTSKTVVTPVSQRLYNAGLKLDEAEQISGVIEKVMNGTAITEDEAELITVSNAAVRSMLQEVVGVELDEDATIGRIMDTLNDVAANMASVKEMQSDIRQNAEQVAKARMPIPPAQTRSTITLGDTEYSHDEFVRDYMNQHGVSQAVAEQAWQQRATVDAALSGEEESNGTRTVPGYPEGRHVDLAAGGQVRGVQERDAGSGRAPVARGAESSGRENSLGTRTNSTPIQGAEAEEVITKLNAKQRDFVKECKDDGFESVTLVKGPLLYVKADGTKVEVNALVNSRGDLVIRWGNPRVSPYKVANHERIHRWLSQFTDAERAKYVSDALYEIFGEGSEEFAAIYDIYAKKYGNAYGDLSGLAFQNAIFEEIFADLYAGMDLYNAGTAQFQQQAEMYVENTNLRGQFFGEESTSETNYGESFERFNLADPFRESTDWDIPSDVRPFPGEEPMHEQMDRFSVSSMAEGGNFDLLFNESGQPYALVNKDTGERVTEVTADMMIGTPLGDVVQMAVDNGNITEDEAKVQRQMLADAMNLIVKYNDAAVVWELAGSQLFSAIKSNSDKQYNKTIDFSTICKKTMAIVDAMSETMKRLGRGLTRREVEAVYLETGKAGEATPCPVCYVFSRWMGIGNLLDQMSKFQDKYAGKSEEELVSFMQNIENRARAYAAAASKTKQEEFYDKNGNLKIGKVISDMKSKPNSSAASAIKKLNQHQQANDAIAELTRNLPNATPEQAARWNSLIKVLKRNVLKDSKIAELQEQMAQADAAVEDYEVYQWLAKTVLMSDASQVNEDGEAIGSWKKNPNFKPVPKDILFDLNRGGDFAKDYPLSWAFRTGKGCAMGKAITPYADARVGETIQGVAMDVKNIRVGSEINEFLNGDTKKQQKTLESARKKQKQQNLIGGMRYQSTSDFRYEFGSDYLMTFFEMQALGANVQLYTKVIESVDFLASTGADCNLSVMPLGDGYVIDPKTGKKKLAFSNVTGINAEAAIKKAKQYDNVQLILVGINDENIRLALEGTDVTFVIPFHGSGQSVHQVQTLMDLLGEHLDVTQAQDYTSVQSDHVSPKQTAEQKAMWDLRVDIITGKCADGLTTEQQALLAKNQHLQKLYDMFYVDETSPAYQNFLGNDQAGQIFPYEYWNREGDYEHADENGRTFQEYCKSMGIIPRFSGINSKGARVGFGDFTKDKGYWKLLIDRSMYENVYDENGDWIGYGKYRDQQQINMSSVKLSNLAPQYGPFREGEMSKQYDATHSEADRQNLDTIVTNSIQRIEAMRDKGDVFDKTQVNKGFRTNIMQANAELRGLDNVRASAAGTDLTEDQSVDYNGSTYPVQEEHQNEPGRNDVGTDRRSVPLAGGQPGGVQTRASEYAEPASDAGRGVRSGPNASAESSSRRPLAEASAWGDLSREQQAKVTKIINASFFGPEAEMLRESLEADGESIVEWAYKKMFDRGTKHEGIELVIKSPADTMKEILSVLNTEDTSARLTESQQKNRDFNDRQTEVGSPLKTLQGTTIKRYKGIAGKEVSPQVYVHKDYAGQVVPAEALSKAEAVLSQEYPDFNYNTIMYDRKSGVIRFDEAPDFDSAREPIAGNTVTVYPDGSTRTGYSDSIWHHKWLWVDNDYEGFDVEDSWNWSKQWLNTIRPVDPGEHKFNSSFSQRGIANGTGHGTANWNEQLEYFGLPLDGESDVRASVADDTAPVAQQYSSEDTSINNNKLPSVFTNKWFTNQLEPGGVNIDIGGGKYDNATEYLNREYDVTNMVFDPFNRDREHNSKVLDFITSGNEADTATCANVLNVINEAAARENVILECAKAIKPDGKAFFLIYEGDGTGNGRTTRTPVRNRDGTIAKDENGKTLYSTSWQEHRKAGTYVDEIKKYFDTVKPHGNLIEASDPKANLPKAAWEVTPGEAVRFSFAGSNAETADDRNRQRAERMEEEGYDSEEIRKETGWFRGMDDEWRFEIDNKEMSLSDAYSPDRDSYKLGELVNHDKLFEAYPSLAEYTVEVADLDNGTLGRFNKYAHEITVDRSLFADKEELRKTIIHEIQHAIQAIEGFAYGSSPAYWRQNMNRRHSDLRNRMLDLTDELRAAEGDLEDELFYSGYERKKQEVESRIWMSEISRAEGEKELQDFLKERSPEGYDLLQRVEQMREELKQVKADLRKSPSASDLYKRTAGEIEARDVEKRLNLDEKKRQNKRPDVDRKNVVFARYSAAPTDSENSEETSTNPYKEGSFESMAFDLLKKAQNPQELQDWINELRQKQADAKEAGQLKAPVIPSADKATPVNKTQQKIRENQLAKLLEKYGAFKQGEKAARNQPIPEKISDDRRVRRYVRTAAEAEATPQRLAERIGGETLVNELLSYTPITDSDAMAVANREFNRLGYKKALKEWQSKSGTDHFPTKNDIAFGSKLLVEAMRNGDDAVAMQTLADLAAMETQAGQVAQAARLLKQLGPSGQLYYVQKAVDRLNHQNEGRIAKGTMDPIIIDQDLAKAVILSEAQEEMDDAMEALKQDIADKLPVTLKDRWDAWRYLAMLGNPRTHFRNYLGNLVFSPVRFTKDLLAAAGEKMFIQDESQRTKDAKALLKDPRYNEIRQFAEEDFKVMESDLTGDGKMNPLNEIMGMRKVLPGILDKASRKNDDLLKKEDVIFLRKAYVSALTQFIAARGLSLEDLSSGSFESNKLMNEARRYAALEAQKATYRDFSRVAAALNSLRRTAPGLSPLLDGLMPFTKTPINILKRGLEYSPAGLAKALTVDLKKVQKGDMTAAEAIDNVAAGMTGTGVALLGWLLASLGMARGGADDDDKKDKLEKAQGHQDYSLEIGGKSYTIDWMAPVALPFFVGVEAYNQLTGEGQASFMDFVNAVTLIAEPMMSLSMLDGINSTLSAVRSGSNSPIQSVATNILASYISQGAPTLLGQIARTIDPDRRSTYVDKNSENPAFMQRFVQNLQSKVPVLSSQKMAYVDTWGRKDTNESIILRGLENFISPGYANRVNETPVDTELLRLAEATGNNKVLPSEAAKYFQVEGETLNLNAKQYEQYKTTTGQTAFKLLGDLFADPVYAAMDDAQKANAVEQAMKIATAIGKQDVAPTYKTDGWIQRAIDHDNLETASMFHMLKNAETGLSNYQLISAMDWLNDEEKGELVMQEHPNTYRQMTDYTRKGYKFTLTDENIAREREIYESLFWPAYNELISSSKFQKASVAKQADMLSKMQSTLGTEARKRLGKELRSAGIKSHKPSNADVPDNVTNLYDLLNRP